MLCAEKDLLLQVGFFKLSWGVVNLWLAGRCPASLAEFVASAPLTPLLKPDNGVRPIVVGAIWRRLVSKVAMRRLREDMVNYLRDFQFGVGIPNGAEAVLHSANRFIDCYHADGSLVMLTIDFSNAFNLVDRSAMLKEVHRVCPSLSPWVNFLYGQPARLYVEDNCIWSTTGVQQGDPLGPLLFALALHPLITRVQEQCRLLFHAWYLDDGTIIGPVREVAKALEVISREGPSLGLQLNVQKTELFWPSCNGEKFVAGLFPEDIGRPKLGVKLLGGAVSRDRDFISDMAVKRASRAVDLMRVLPQLKNPQCELLLLRSCMGVAKLIFGHRTCQPSYVGAAVTLFDEGLRQAIDDIVVGRGGAFFGDLQWRLASLPIKEGGLGLLSAGDVSSFAFVASRVQSLELQDHILRACCMGDLDSDFRAALDGLQAVLPDVDLGGFANKDTAPREPQTILASAFYGKTVKEINGVFGPHAQDFLTVIPIEGLGQCMSAVEYRSVLKYRLMIPLYPEDEPCPVCRKVCLDSFGEHALHCKELHGFKYRHDLVRDVLFDVLKRAGIAAKKEAPVNFLTDPKEGRSSLRPADVLVFGWSGGKHACIDLTGVSPLASFRGSGFVSGQATRKAEAGKISKHEQACIDNQHAFLPFAFDTFGCLAPVASGFLKRVQKAALAHATVFVGHSYVFSRVGFAIQKGVAAQLVARLPTHDL
ncbi:putative RNA-directed DNA polymerase [Helianthus annuus]|nr:putative RNA-directed DNA polymerase [Helianthus annuus]